MAGQCLEEGMLYNSPGADNSMSTQTAVPTSKRLVSARVSYAEERKRAILFPS